jgi:glutathione S-transferase
LHPEPPLIGTTPQERAAVTALNRQIERDGFYAAMDAFRNATKGLKGRALPGPHDYEQIPALAERGRVRIEHFFRAMDARLATREFVAGSRYTLADISTLVLTDFAAWAKLKPPEDCVNLRRWHAEVSARPSARA